jgi:hypothetical protein
LPFPQKSLKSPKLIEKHVTFTLRERSVAGDDTRDLPRKSGRLVEKSWEHSERLLLRREQIDAPLMICVDRAIAT